MKCKLIPLRFNELLDRPPRCGASPIRLLLLASRRNTQAVLTIIGPPLAVFFDHMRLLPPLVAQHPKMPAIAATNDPTAFLAGIHRAAWGIIGLHPP
jgi:hypothetical protein